MAVPDFQILMLPLLKLAGDGQPHTFAEAVERLTEEFQLSDADRTQLLRSGQTRMYNRAAWTLTYLKRAGLLQAVGLGRFQLTDRGREVLDSRPAAIDVAFLTNLCPEMSDLRKTRARSEVAGEEPLATFNTADSTWNQRAGVEERVRETMELSIPDEGWLKQGSDSVGVSHQYCGAVGKQARCQVAVELVVSDGEVAAPVGGGTFQTNLPAGKQIRDRTVSNTGAKGIRFQRFSDIRDCPLKT